MANTDYVAFRAAIFVLIRDGQGRVLLQKRAGTDYMPGYYDLPSGHVEAGESLTAAAARELAEEVGLHVDERDLRLLHVGLNDLDYPYLNVAFEATMWKGEPTIGEPHKCSAIGFFDPGQLPDKCTLAVRLLERSGFRLSTDVPYVDITAYESIMDEPFQLIPLA